MKVPERIINYLKELAEESKKTFQIDSSKKLANQKVTVKVGSKTYTATTNSNGIAIVKHKVTSIGNITITANYAGDNVYGDHGHRFQSDWGHKVS